MGLNPRKLLRNTDGRGDSASVFLLFLIVVLPAACLIWFMNAAIQNEGVAVRERLLVVYRSYLSNQRERVDRYWQETGRRLDALLLDAPAPEVFARAVREGLADAVVVFGVDKRIAFPNNIPSVPAASTEHEARWARVNRLEQFEKSFPAAAAQYDALARETSDVNIADRALQGEVRCLVRSGQTNAAIKIVLEKMERFAGGLDLQGRAIVPNAELLVLELLRDPSLPLFQQAKERLRKRLEDYAASPLAPAQRRFLMKEWTRLCPGGPSFSTFQGEELLARLFERQVPEPGEAVVAPSVIAGVSRFTTASGRVMILMGDETLRSRILATFNEAGRLSGASVILLPPTGGPENVLLSIPASAQMPGWRLGLRLTDTRAMDSLARRQALIYRSSGALVLVFVAFLAVLGMRAVRRQAALARLKNDLTATVSHELKTPLSSMRVLVDTLLETKELNERTTREYLQLIAVENERLSRLIENFLTFSRLERNKYAFQFAPVSPGAILADVGRILRERFKMTSDAFQIEPGSALPFIMADGESLARALLNLAENAHKYSQEIKRIILRAYVQSEQVVFEVEDNGIGIAPGERKKIFDRFYQVDQNLSRATGGCGLGLSIVLFIVRAHRGRIDVRSEPGVGSTFAISIPVSAQAEVK